jgi:hypothetical protein
VKHPFCSVVGSICEFLAEVGDYQPDEHGPNYLSNLQLIPGQSEDMEKKIAELHKLHKYENKFICYSINVTSYQFNLFYLLLSNNFKHHS